MEPRTTSNGSHTGSSSVCSLCSKPSLLLFSGSFLSGDISDSVSLFTSSVLAVHNKLQTSFLILCKSTSLTLTLSSNSSRMLRMKELMKPRSKLNKLLLTPLLLWREFNSLIKLKLQWTRPPSLKQNEIKKRMCKKSINARKGNRFKQTCEFSGLERLACLSLIIIAWKCLFLHF